MSSELRAHRFLGLGFRRQVPIGPYIVDFVCHAAGLVIELDGGQHSATKGLRHDMRRTAYLASKGFRVIRFDNISVLTNRIGVLEAIYAVLTGPLPDPPPQAGEGMVPASPPTSPASAPTPPASAREAPQSRRPSSPPLAGES